MNVEPSKTFCILPWIHIYVNPDGSVLPCCIGDHNIHLGNTRFNTITEIWNSDQYKAMRQNMLAGKRCDECKACYSSEDAGLNSFRKSVNKQYNKYFHLANDTQEDGFLPSMNLRYFDVRWSNICNFKCRSCSGTYSSSWATEEKRPNVYIFAGGKNNDDLYDQFLPYLKDIEEFYFAGGEPLLTDKHYDILEYLISIGKTDVKLRYNTNLSSLTYKKSSVLDLWKNFKNINVDASLDSWGDRAEYIREGTDWKLIEQNIKNIQSVTPHVNLQINSVVSIFNISTMAEFYNYLIDNSIFDKNKFYPNHYNLLNPNFYNVNIIPDELKTRIKNSLSSVSISKNIDQKIQDMIKFLDSSTYDRNLHMEFIEQTKHYDAIRNRNFINTFPEISEMYGIK